MTGPKVNQLSSVNPVVLKRSSFACGVLVKDVLLMAMACSLIVVCG
jgi:hypothetical protein